VACLTCCLTLGTLAGTAGLGEMVLPAFLLAGIGCVFWSFLASLAAGDTEAPPALPRASLPVAGPRWADRDKAALPHTVKPAEGGLTGGD
jgi:hypothetical protein